MAIGQQVEPEYWPQQGYKIQSFCPGKQPDLASLPGLKMLGNDVPKTSAVKYLGVLLDDTLSFEAHIKSLCTKSKKYVGYFYSIRNKLTPHCLRTLYFAFVLSNLFNVGLNS